MPIVMLQILERQPTDYQYQTNANVDPNAKARILMPPSNIRGLRIHSHEHFVQTSACRRTDTGIRNSAILIC